MSPTSEPQTSRAVGLKASLFIDLLRAFISISRMFSYSFFSSLFVSVNKEEEEKMQDHGTVLAHTIILSLTLPTKKGFQDFCYPSSHLLCFSSVTKATDKNKHDL